MNRNRWIVPNLTEFKRPVWDFTGQSLLLSGY